MLLIERFIYYFFFITLTPALISFSLLYFYSTFCTVIDYLLLLLLLPSSPSNSSSSLLLTCRFQYVVGMGWVNWSLVILSLFLRWFFFFVFFFYREVRVEYLQNLIKRDIYKKKREQSFRYQCPFLFLKITTLPPHLSLRLTAMQCGGRDETD